MSTSFPVAPLARRNKPAASTLAAVVSEFLTFKLGREEYGIDIQSVQEIRSFEEPTQLANSPAFLKGVINLRGVIVPIVDMRIKFNLGEALYNGFTVVIILNIGDRMIGMVVDAVSDVIQLTAEQMRPLPEFSETMDNAYLLAMGSVGDRMITLMDIKTLMRSPEMGLVNQVAQVVH